MNAPLTMPAPLVFTDNAAAKVQDLIYDEGNPDLKLRVFVQGGGCSGGTTDVERIEPRLQGFCLVARGRSSLLLVLTVRDGQGVLVQTLCFGGPAAPQPHARENHGHAELVGQVASNIRGLRPPEPYKGKGVRYADEVVVLKETKKK